MVTKPCKAELTITRIKMNPQKWVLSCETNSINHLNSSIFVLAFLVSISIVVPLFPKNKKRFPACFCKFYLACPGIEPGVAILVRCSQAVLSAPGLAFLLGLRRNSSVVASIIASYPCASHIIYQRHSRLIFWWRRSMALQIRLFH